MSYDKLSNENEEQYILRICSMKESQGWTWQNIADILNESLGYNYGESAYRKKCRVLIKWWKQMKVHFYRRWISWKIRSERKGIEKERKKLQTEKVEYNRWLREEAREELIAEHIAEAIREMPKLDIPRVIEPKYNTRFGNLVFADPHYGKDLCIQGLFGEILNEYSPEIFEKECGIYLIKFFRFVIKKALIY